MPTLLLMRHAKSSWKEASLSDHDRPLNRRGRKAAPQMGRLIRKHDLIPDRILCSTSVRTRQTCELLLSEWPQSPPVEFLAELYLCPADELIGVVQENAADAQRVLLLGHNPGFADFLANAVGYVEKFPTVAVASLQIPGDNWRTLDPDTPWRLQHLWRPRDLD